MLEEIRDGVERKESKPVCPLKINQVIYTANLKEGFGISKLKEKQLA